MNIYQKDIEIKRSDGQIEKLGDYQGRVLLIVNTASKCGFTKQFKGLEEIYQKYKDRGFTVLGFPCNQFKEQDPGTDEEIVSFCQKNFGVSFPLFSKIEVNGQNRHPLYELLLGQKKIRWNFEKFLISPSGQFIKHYSSLKKPKAIAKAIEKLLSC